MFIAIVLSCFQSWSERLIFEVGRNQYKDVYLVKILRTGGCECRVLLNEAPLPYYQHSRNGMKEETELMKMPNDGKKNCEMLSSGHYVAIAFINDMVTYTRPIQDQASQYYVS